MYLMYSRVRTKPFRFFSVWSKIITNINTKNKTHIHTKNKTSIHPKNQIFCGRQASMCEGGSDGVQDENRVTAKPNSGAAPKPGTHLQRHPSRGKWGSISKYTEPSSGKKVYRKKGKKRAYAVADVTCEKFARRGSLPSCCMASSRHRTCPNAMTANAMSHCLACNEQ